ncbi:2-oxoglutarate (2OG) and Fe(II)-dependent oxygenase superfamily protein isoform X2 [Wolffia australiana]
MAGEVTGNAIRTEVAITISYSELQDTELDLSAKIKEGFGPHGLGIISISDVPEFSHLRRSLLHLSPRLARLSEKYKEELEDPESRYNFGWSHGKEKLESGKLDTFKGSFYANPILDVPTNDLSLIERYPSYCRPNKWPANSLPELERAFKALGKLMLDIGLLLAYHCDKYVSKCEAVQPAESMGGILQRSRCHKGRLLYYFPRQESGRLQDNLGPASWCGWHTDHGSLTGLTCGMFTRNGDEILPPDSAAGLYIRTRSDEVVKEDQVAYQIGETTEILSKGHLCVTPHCVKAPEGDEAIGVERSTFALFMQPDWDQQLGFGSEFCLHKEMIPSGSTLSFGQYSEILLNEYYYQRVSGGAAPGDKIEEEKVNA